MIRGSSSARPGATNHGPNMIETNPIHAQIADLRGRVESLRGYL
jgi:hypothetical protein